LLQINANPIVGNCLFPFDQQEIVIVQFQIALIVYIEIYFSGLCCIGRGKQREIKIVIVKRAANYLGLTRTIEVGEYPVILSQPVVRISDQVFTLLIDFIVVRITAVIAAKFLVASSVYSFSTLQTYFSFHKTVF
jgi:hypothetical protein